MIEKNDGKLPPRHPDFPDISEENKLRHVFLYGLLSLGATQMMPRDYSNDPLLNLSPAHLAMGLMMNPAILAAAWEHLLLYGDGSKVNTDMFNRDSSWRNWIRKKLERPADEFVAQLERGDLPETKEALISRAEDVISDEHARFDRKLTLARFTRHFAKEVKAVLHKMDDVIFDGAMSKRRAPELEPAVQQAWIEPYEERSVFPDTRAHRDGELHEFFVSKRQHMESRVWAAVGKVLGQDPLIETRLCLRPEIAKALGHNRVEAEGRLLRADDEAMDATIHATDWKPAYDEAGKRIGGLELVVNRPASSVTNEREIIEAPERSSEIG